MELYSMPQLEKTTPVFSDSQYEGGGDNIITQRASNNDVKKFPSVSTEALPLLTSSASWSAVIHRPAEEDSEPDDLPSTVDMDAIKGSPSTPLAASKTSCNSGPVSWDHSKTEHSKREESKEVDGDDDDDDDEDGASDSEESDGDDSDSRDSDDEETGDSDSVNDSGSDTEGSESDSCSWSDSDSDSPTSSCSSHSEGSSHSSHTHQTFSIRENNFDQGGFKLKIAALKINKKVPVKEPDKPDSSEKLERTDKPKDTDKKKCSVSETPKSSKDDKKDKVKCETVSAVVKSTQRCSVAKKSEVSNRRKTRGCRTPLKEKVSTVGGRLYSMRVPASPSLYPCGRGRAHTPHSNSGTEDDSDSEDDGDVAEISQLAQELGHIDEHPDTLPISDLQEINQEDLAAILPDVTATDNHEDEAGPPFDGFEDVSSESGKVATQQRGGNDSSSDVELPEQVVSEAIKRIHLDNEDAGDHRTGNSGSSGGESEEEGKAGDVASSTQTIGPYSSSLLQQFVEKTEILSSQVSSSQDTAKAVLGRAKREEPHRRKRGRPPKLARKINNVQISETSNQAECSSVNKCMPELEAYMPLDCSVSNVSPDSGIQSVAGSPIHQSCSPSSHTAIHSPGSNVNNKVTSPVSSPHSIREMTPPPPTLFPGEQRQGPVKRGPGRPSRNNKVVRRFHTDRRGPGRPKGSGKKLKTGKQSTVRSDPLSAVTASGTDSGDEIPPTPSPVPIAPVKRGPGRPKKAPPVLEPNLPILIGEPKDRKETTKSASKRKSTVVGKSCEDSYERRLVKSEGCGDVIVKQKSNVSEVCERVNKRLDVPDNSDFKRFPAKSSKVKLKEINQRKLDGIIGSKGTLGDERRKKGRRRRDREEMKEKITNNSKAVAIHGPRQRHPSCAGVSSASTSHQGTLLQKGLMPKPIPKVLCFPSGVTHHKHKKRKKLRIVRSDKTVIGPAFLVELEKLAQDFNRLCTIAKCGAGSGNLKSGDAALPSIFRVKRIVKKRKGSEKSRASDRESGTEGDGKEKSRQRRPKKSTIEVPKGHERPEANNEQRLPLKKRHYHMSTAATPVSTSLDTNKIDLIPENSRKSSSMERLLQDKDKINDKANSNNATNPVCRNQIKPNDKLNVTLKDKPGDKLNCGPNVINKNLNQIEFKTKINLDGRNSIDEAIEACINRYTTTSTLDRIPQGQRSVIVTPKKRHRLENTTAVCNINKSPCSSISKGKELMIEGLVSNNNNSNSSNNNNSCMPNKRTISRSASNNSVALPMPPCVVSLHTPIISDTKQGHVSLEMATKSNDAESSLNSLPSAVKPETLTSKASSPIKISCSSTKISSKLSSPTRKQTSPGSKAVSKSSSINKIVSQTNKSPSKSISGSNKSLEVINHSPITRSTNCKDVSQISKSSSLTKVISVANRDSVIVEKSSSGDKVFPHSRRLASQLSKAHIVSGRANVARLLTSNANEKGRNINIERSIRHNLRLKRINCVDKQDISMRRSNIKKNKLIRDVRVHVTKLSPVDLKKAAGAVKERARRRKAINRTGFPVKRKKKKRPLLTEQIVQFSSPAQIVSMPFVQNEDKCVLNSVVPVLNEVFNEISNDDVINSNLTDDSLNDNMKISKTDSIISKSEKGKSRKLESLKPQLLELVHTSMDRLVVNDRIDLFDTSMQSIREKGRKHEICKDDYDTERETDMLYNRRCKSGSLDTNSKCDVDASDDESLCAAEDMILPPCEGRIKTKRKRESSQDELGLQSRRHKRSREDDTDRDDVSDVVLPFDTILCSDVPSGDESTKSCQRKKQPRWRKKFLAAGLFSDYYKTDTRRPPSDVGKSRLLYKPEEHQHGLLPPPYHCGKYLRQRRVEFKLPYDLWWLHTHSQLPGRDRVPSWNYKKIRTNVYYDVKPTYMYEAQACNCHQPGTTIKKACGEDCINRMVFSECSPQLCPCKDLCSNQRIQKHEWAPGLEKFMTKDKGWGVRTKYHIKSGEFILEYVGEVVSEKEFKDRMASRYINDTHHYCLNLDGGLVIDGHRMGGDGRFVNHSCEPNCEMQKWSVNGLFRMALFALRDIEPLEELSYDYNFSLFNPAEGQPCKCGSINCRGVIGGKSQRVNGSVTRIDDKGERRMVGRPRKNSRKNSACITSNKLKYKKRIGENNSSQRHCNMTPVKPMSHQQRCFAQMHHCFLLRNLEKVKRLRERLKQASRRDDPVVCNYARPQVKQSDVFLTQLNALSTPRNIRTRRLAQAEDNPEMTRTARLAYVFKDLYNAVVSAKDEHGEMLADPFLTLPSKRKLPQYYQRVTDPIDLCTLEQNIVTGFYKTVESFDQDMTRLFTNNVRFFGRTSELGITATRLRKVYNMEKMKFVSQLEEILGENPPASFLPEHDPADEEEDVIRCICGLYKDEGMMIQCERCLVWQHCDCVRADEDVEHYLCEQCNPRPVELEILMSPQPHYATPGLTYYITLLRGTLQLRQGDTVYVLRDMIEENAPKTSPPTKHTYKTVKDIKYSDLDIFRIERLWKDEKNEKFAFGHHYLRPHETYHEPSRKFFPNEVMRVPLYEVVPLDLIMGHCWVLDLNTFCKGRPVGAPEEHVYICEYRVDKSAHLFTKIAKPRHSVCTKTYAFETFDTRLKPQRTYTPHGPVAPRSRGRSTSSRTNEEDIKPQPQAPPSAQPNHHDDDEEVPLARRADQKQRLNLILLRLLARLPSKQPLDLSFLLEPGRRHRKKPTILNP